MSDVKERPLAMTHQRVTALLSPALLHYRLRILRGPVFFAVAILIILLTEKPDIPWKFGHWFFSYEYGFMKRGLMGELLDWLPAGPPFIFFVAISVLALVAIAVLFFNIIKDMSNRDFFAFSAFFLLIPLLFRNYVHDFGRFDQIAILFVLLQIHFVGDKLKSNWLLFFSPMLLLVHEAIALWAFPVIFTIAFFENRPMLYWVVPASIVCAVSLVVWGGPDVDLHMYNERLQEWARPVSIHWALVFSLTTDVSEAVTRYIPYFWEVFNSPRGYLALFFFLASALPLFLIKDRLLLFFNLAALMSACTLFVLAVDYWRWVSLLGTIILFSLLYAHKKALLSNPPQLGYYFMLIGVLGLFFEPLGIYPEILADVDLSPKHLQFFGPKGG